MGWYLLLTPLLALAVLLVLGFAGCSFEHGTLPPPPPIFILTLAVRVPVALSVIATRFEWTEPAATTPTPATDVTATTEGDTVVISHVVGPLIEGTWLASCRLQVQDASGQRDTDNGDGMFVDAPESSTALFEARGSPSTNNFKVLFVGRVAT
jgi:hypothetical protein